MAYSTNRIQSRKTEKRSSWLQTVSDNFLTKPDDNFFYELEAATVVDVVLDEKHKLFQTSSPLVEINIPDWNAAFPTQRKDYSWIGRIQVRLIHSQKNVKPEDLIWAVPLESNISEFPLVGEMVVISRYLGVNYYSRKVNTRNWINHSVAFAREVQYGQKNRVNKFKASPAKVESTPNDFINSAGFVFENNNQIRPLRRYEGDLLYESRFGSSIRFGNYLEKGTSWNTGRNENTEGFGVGRQPTFAGNPCLILRNKQRPLLTPDEKMNYQFPVKESYNFDGSSLWMTSGLVKIPPRFFTAKKIWPQEEQGAWNGDGENFGLNWDGDQITMKSDRMVLESKKKEFAISSKGRFVTVTDSTYTVDSDKEIVFTTNAQTSINTPKLYLGERNKEGEPVVLGTSFVNWMSEWCDLVIAHKHKYNWWAHGGQNLTKPPHNKGKMSSHKGKLNKTLSTRVFTVGGSGGYPGVNEPGHDGGQVEAKTVNPDSESDYK
jgi:hypothetical protein